MSVHLYARSCYSLLESSAKIKDLVRRAKEYGYDSLALTDHNVLHGAPVFLRECRKEGIRPIFGMEADCMFHDEKIPFLLLAKDNAGYKNLILLSTLIQSSGACSEEDLIRLSGHCFLIVFSEGGWIDADLIADDRDRVSEKLRIMKEELPAFDVALSYMDASLWRQRSGMLKRVCMSLKIPVCALNRIYYCDEEDAVSFRIMQGIRLSRTVSDQSLPMLKGRYLISKERMSQLYEAPELERTDEIARQCTADLDIGSTGLPEFPVPSGLTSGQYLTQLCLAGLDKRLEGRRNPDYLKRLKYELDVILKMHFEDYFLIVYDFIRYARKSGIYVGPGRGSAAGSLVAYTLGITQIDPMEYGLLFERFLNPERISMPDIDTDFPDNRRQDVIDYVYRKYGHEHIANIVTFGTLRAKQVIRDVAKVLEIPARDTEALLRLIPNTPKITLTEAAEKNPRLKQMVHSDRKLEELFRNALKLEGLPRHASVHAAGIVMSRKNLDEIVPLMQMEEGMATVQYTMEHLEERGLIKMDFLGLRNLTIIDDIVRRIQQSEPDFRIMKIPMDDPLTYEIFRRCDTTGVFQFESSGMKNLLRKMKPVCFEDLTAALALYRPGPMENIPVYLANREDPSKIVYPDEKLKPVLESTYGVAVYQEQIMNIARSAAGFSLGRADVLRKAISKKDAGQMEQLKEEFIGGCLKNGYAKQTAENLFSWIEKFAGYGFNRSHSVAYGVVAYQLAYLKAQYPMYFYCALIDSVIGDETRSAQYIDECRRRNIRVGYPDVCMSEEGCTDVRGKIILPLTVIHGVGAHLAEGILNERKKGQFSDYFDFVVRTCTLKISRSLLETMIDAGALDCFNETRSTMKGMLDEALSYAELVRIDHNGTQLFDMSLVSRPLITKLADSTSRRSELEKEALGFYIGPHPIIELRQKLRYDVPSIAALKQMQGPVNGFAVIQRVHQHRTKKGDMMAFLDIMDETGEMDLTVMPNLYRQYGSELVKGNYILFHGKMEKEDSCLADRIRITVMKR